jgi:hypothetical protein
VTSRNALPDDPDWCGHPFVSLRTWTCADCDRPVTAGTRRRMENAPTKARKGTVWMLEVGYQDEVNSDGDPHRWVEGVYTDRAKIGRLLVRNLVVEADTIRDVMRRTHWYQGAYNVMLFEGWAEENNDRGRVESFYLSTHGIDTGW